MANPKEYLNRIWTIFRKLGITDDLTIIESIAALLLPENMPEAKLRPKVPVLPSTDLAQIKIALAEATEAVGGAAPLFDHFVIFQLPQMIAGGRYPTPRHLAKTMAHLARVEKGDSLADLACGSGGLLVAAAAVQPRVTGIEISPNWARLAWTNAVLHGLSGPDISLGKTSSRIFSPNLDGEDFFEPDIYIGNAFSVLADSLERPDFDCILINPPFGEVIDAYLVNQLPLQIKSGRSETLFTALALQKLKPGGRLAILLPSGSLFSTSIGEQTLRNILLEAHQLETVISLPKDAFQPYSSLQTHLLLVRKPESREMTPAREVWFYHVQHDGFTGGRNRQPDPSIMNSLSWKQQS